MLRPGMIVRTRDGRVVMLMGRNGCHRWMWWGHRLKPDGRHCLRPDKNTMPVFLARDVVSIWVDDAAGFRGVLPGIFEER